MPKTKKRVSKSKLQSKKNEKTSSTKKQSNKKRKEKNSKKRNSRKSNIVKKTSTSEKKSLIKPIFITLLILLISVLELFSNGETLFFWFTFVVSGIILVPNLLWIKTGRGVPFIFPYILTMFKTKKTINLINYLGKHGTFLEKISIIGLFVGFGIVGVDYWVARKYKGIKRKIILLIATIILGIVFHFGLGWLFSVPLLAPLYLMGLIGFILLGLGGLSIAFLLGYGFLSIIALFNAQQICPSVAPVLPGVPIPGFGVVVPFIAWISLAAIIIIHEFSHGILLVKYKEKLKSVGLLLAGIFPVGAFVEQDDKTFLKNDEKNQLLVLSAGPTSNLFTMFIGIILLFAFAFVAAPLVETANMEYEKAYDGVMVNEVMREIEFCAIRVDSPAKGMLFEGDKILSVNNKDVNYMSDIILEINDSNLLNFIVLRGEEIKEVEIEPHYFESFGIRRIGVVFGLAPTDYQVPPQTELKMSILNSINIIIFFFIFLSFAVGMFNFLPSDPLDGGRMAKIMLVPYFGFMKFDSKEETQKFIGRLFVWLFIISILLNLLPYLTMFWF